MSELLIAVTSLVGGGHLLLDIYSRPESEGYSVWHWVWPLQGQQKLLSLVLTGAESLLWSRGWRQEGKGMLTHDKGSTRNQTLPHGAGCSSLWEGSPAGVPGAGEDRGASGF